MTANLHDDITRCRDTSQIPTPQDVSVTINQSNFSSVTIHWNIPLTPLTKDIQKYNIRVSPLLDMTESTEFTVSVLKNQAKYTVPQPTWEAPLYTQVQTVLEGGLKGVWSDKSFKWRISRECGDDYLDTSSISPANWSCVDCPIGAKCDGRPWFR